jgi:hypothetical protein
MPQILNAGARWREWWRSPGNARRALRAGITGLLALVLVVFAWPYVKLVALVSFFASEAYPNGVSEGLRMPWDSMQTLSAYPPRHLATYLQAPSARWRATAASALWYQATEKMAGDWHGVPAALAAAAIGDPEPTIRGLARDALIGLPQIEPDEALAILRLVAEQPAADRRFELINVVADRSPPTHESLRELAVTLSKSHRFEDQLLALQVLANWFSQSEWLEHLFHRLRAEPEAETLGFADVLRFHVAHARPDLVESLFAGDERQQRLGLLAVAEIVARPPSAMDFYTGYVRQPPENASLKAQRRANLATHAELIQNAEQTATAFYLSSESVRQQVGEAFFRRHPAGAVLLVRCLKKLPAERHEALLDVAQQVQAYGGAHEARFGLEETELLLNQLFSPDPKTQEFASRILSWGFGGSYFEQDVAPSAERWSAFFAKLLQENPSGPGAGVALQHFSLHPTFDPALIPAMESAIRTYSTHFVGEKAFQMLIDHFPNHPRVQALAWEAISDVRWGILFNPAADFLLRTAPEPSSVFARLLQSYRTSDDGKRGHYRWAILRWWPKFGPKDDAALTAQIVDEGLEHSWYEPDRRTLTALVAAVDPQIVEDRLLAKLKDWNTRVAQDLNLDFRMVATRYEWIPRFRHSAERFARELLASPDASSRIKGLQVFATLGIRPTEVDRHVLALLDDSDYVVQINAADLASALGLEHAAVLERLAAMTHEEQPEMLRAAGLRNFAILQPDTRDTAAMASDLIDDPQLAVRIEAQRILRGDRRTPNTPRGVRE